MSKRNPYATARKVWDATFITLRLLPIAVVVITAGVIAVIELGWWALLIIPGVVALVVLANWARDAVERSQNRWRAREYEWDRKRKQEKLREFQAGEYTEGESE